MFARLRSTSDLNPIQTREIMFRSSRRTISMVFYALDPISVIRFLSAFQNLHFGEDFGPK
jgi:hypothetical protein